MYRRLILLLVFSLLFVSACSSENEETVPVIQVEIYQPPTKVMLPEEIEDYSRPETIALPDTPTYIPAPLTSPEPRNAVPVSLTLLVNGTFTTFDAKNIDGANYFRFQDLQYALEGTLLQKNILRDDLPISRYVTDDYTYLNLRQFLENFERLRVTWVGSRNTIIITNDYSYLPDPIYLPERIFRAESLPEHIVKQITGSSFHPDAPFDLCHLSYLTITHVDFGGFSRVGHLVVAASIADEVLDIFREIYEYGFPIARMRLIDYYGALDYYSMADNNSVAFNFRVIAGTDRLSRHAWGMAIDINPVQNPYVRGDTIWPAAGYAYLDRANVRPGMIIPDDVVYRAFTSRGWTWGGHWRVPIDYHHFERR